MQTPIEKITLETFLSMPETKPASEFIDGQITQKPMPGGQLSLLKLCLSAAINRVVEKPKIAIALPGIRSTFDGRSIVSDVGIFTWKNMPLEANGEIANDFNVRPDWIVEILSPEQSATIVTDKILHSLDHGTEMAWIIDSQVQLIVAYPKNQQPQAFNHKRSQLPVPSFANSVSLTHSDVFGWLKL